MDADSVYGGVYPVDFGDSVGDIAAIDFGNSLEMDGGGIAIAADAGGAELSDDDEMTMVEDVAQPAPPAALPAANRPDASAFFPRSVVPPEMSPAPSASSVDSPAKRKRVEEYDDGDRDSYGFGSPSGAAAAVGAGDPSVRVECLRRRALLDDYIGHVREADKRSKKKRQRRNNLNRQREKEFAARVRDLDRMAQRVGKEMEKKEAKIVRDQLREERAHEKALKEEEKLMMRAEKERLRVAEREKRLAHLQGLKDQAAVRRKEELDRRRAEREQSKSEDRERKRIARETARQQMLDVARAAEIARASLLEDTATAPIDGATPLPTPQSLDLDAIAPPAVRAGKGRADAFKELPAESLPDLVALAEFCIQFREVLESAAGKAVDVTLDSAWIAVCGTDNRALKPAEDMHAAFLKVLLADDTAERVMQSDFLLLFEPDILNFAEAARLFLETNRSFAVEHPGVLEQLAALNYHELEPGTRLEILGFLCDLVLQTRSVRKFINDIVPDKIKAIRRRMRELQQQESDLGKSLHHETVENLCTQLLHGAEDATDEAEVELCALFKELVSPEEYPDYYELVKEPISLEQIAEKISDKTYTTFDECVRDFDLMFANARIYNLPASWVCQRASALEAVVKETARPLAIRAGLVNEYHEAMKAHVDSKARAAAERTAQSILEVSNRDASLASAREGAMVLDTPGHPVAAPNGHPHAEGGTFAAGTVNPDATRIAPPPSSDAKCTAFDDEIEELKTSIGHLRRAQRAEKLGRDRHMNSYLLLDALPGLHVIGHDGFVGPRPPDSHPLDDATDAVAAVSVEVADSEPTQITTSDKIATVSPDITTTVTLVDASATSAGPSDMQMDGGATTTDAIPADCPPAPADTTAVPAGSVALDGTALTSARAPSADPVAVPTDAAARPVDAAAMELDGTAATPADAPPTDSVTTPADVAAVPVDAVAILADEPPAENGLATAFATESEESKEDEIASIWAKSQHFHEINPDYEDDATDAIRLEELHAATDPMAGAASPRWHQLVSVSDLATLTQALNSDGYREFNLAELLAARHRVISASIEKANCGDNVASNGSPLSAKSATAVSVLHSQLQKLLLKMDARFAATKDLLEIRQPTVPCEYSGMRFHRNTWRETIKTAQNMTALKTAMIHISRYLSEKRLRAMWSQKSYHQYWANAVNACQTYGGLAVLATGLMESVKKEQRDKPDDFDDDAIEAELAVAVPTMDYNQALCAKCTDGGDLLCCDTCPLSYHGFCLDPPLDTVPTGEWRCPACKNMADTVGNSGYVNLNAKVKDEDTCRRCGIGGQLMWCDSCPNVFHLGCLDPPLVKVPEGDWFCADCNVVRPLVYGKVRGHPLWPARMMVPRGDKAKGQFNKAQLFFFGTHDLQWVGYKNVQSFVSVTDLSTIKCADAKRVKLQEAFDEASKYAENIQRICKEQGLPDPLLIPLEESIGGTSAAPVASAAEVVVPTAAAGQCAFNCGEGFCKMSRVRNLEYCAFHAGLFGNAYAHGTLLHSGAPNAHT
eukprot:m.196263 g.196263  ORF g.196263 m.196263 type:complete len:1521 (+) comp25055_c0_seq1:193-4755(+)